MTNKVFRRNVITLTKTENFSRERKNSNKNFLNGKNVISGIKIN